MLKQYLTLCRPGISGLAALSAATGSVLAPEAALGPFFLSGVSVFLLACGASALNQVQERHIDALMDRTRLRPVASGAMGAGTAVAISLAFIISGLFPLSVISPLPVLLAASALLWYNGVYTFIKKRSAFAAVPGAAVGAIPPAIGWTSAGGVFFDPRLFALCALLFLWQVPHFWLLAIRHRGEYEHAGLPTPFSVLSLRQVDRLTFIWIIATAAATLALPLFGLVRSPALYLGLAPFATWLSWSGAVLLQHRRQGLPERALFGKINGYLIAVLAIVAAFHFLETR